MCPSIINVTHMNDLSEINWKFSILLHVSIRSCCNWNTAPCNMKFRVTIYFPKLRLVRLCCESQNKTQICIKAMLNAHGISADCLRSWFSLHRLRLHVPTTWCIDNDESWRIWRNGVFYSSSCCASIEIIRESFVSRERENADSSQILRFCIQHAWCSSIIHLSSVACTT